MERVASYLRHDFPGVRGWCAAHLWQLIQPIDAFQRKQGVVAPVAEIGVFQGKFFIGLMKTKSVPGNLGLDVFEKQEFNLDLAGSGDHAAFARNIVACGETVDDVEILHRDSLSITDVDILNILDRRHDGFSLFSVDGCHRVEHTINDIELAMRLTHPTGVIFVDDYYNAAWPGVQEGVAKLYLSSAPRFVPLAYSGNKLFLCHISYHDRMRRHVADFLRTEFPRTKVKDVVRFGYDCLNVGPDLTDAPVSHALWEATTPEKALVPA
ncbi:hypothetical protein STVA_20500 [Allostella vacuolata]|nr:hypothetical protein STVA_20500 [Stella vacuolata]